MVRSNRVILDPYLNYFVIRKVNVFVNFQNLLKKEKKERSYKEKRRVKREVVIDVTYKGHTH